MGAAGINIPGMDKLMKAMAGLDGMTYLTEMTMTVEGTGQMADMMKQMGADEDHHRSTRSTTDAISDDLFKVPEGYTIVKSRSGYNAAMKHAAPARPLRPPHSVSTLFAQAPPPASRSSRRRRCPAWSPKSRPSTPPSTPTSSSRWSSSLPTS